MLARLRRLALALVPNTPVMAYPCPIPPVAPPIKQKYKITYPDRKVSFIVDRPPEEYKGMVDERWRV